MLGGTLRLADLLPSLRTELRQELRQRTFGRVSPSARPPSPSARSGGRRVADATRRPWVSLRGPAVRVGFVGGQDATEAAVRGGGIRGVQAGSVLLDPPGVLVLEDAR